MDDVVAEQPDVVEPTTASIETQPPHRALKLVVTLQPSDAGGYRAVLAVGADGCDPLLRCVEGESLASILAAVPTLVAEAEARWQVQPRYPAIKPTAAPTTTTPARVQTEEVPIKPDEVAAAAAPSGEAAAAPRPASAPAGQLSLFG